MPTRMNYTEEQFSAVCEPTNLKIILYIEREPYCLLSSMPSSPTQFQSPLSSESILQPEGPRLYVPPYSSRSSELPELSELSGAFESPQLPDSSRLSELPRLFASPQLPQSSQSPEFPDLPRLFTSPQPPQSSEAPESLQPPESSQSPQLLLQSIESPDTPQSPQLLLRSIEPPDTPPSPQLIQSIEPSESPEITQLPRLHASPQSSQSSQSSQSPASPESSDSQAPPAKTRKLTPPPGNVKILQRLELHDLRCQQANQGEEEDETPIVAEIEFRDESSEQFLHLVGSVRGGGSHILRWYSLINMLGSTRMGIRKWGIRGMERVKEQEESSMDELWNTYGVAGVVFDWEEGWDGIERAWMVRRGMEGEEEQVVDEETIIEGGTQELGQDLNFFATEVQELEPDPYSYSFTEGMLSEGGMWEPATSANSLFEGTQDSMFNMDPNSNPPLGRADTKPSWPSDYCELPEEEMTELTNNFEEAYGCTFSYSEDNDLPLTRKSGANEKASTDADMESKSQMEADEANTMAADMSYARKLAKQVENDMIVARQLAMMEEPSGMNYQMGGETPVWNFPSGNNTFGSNYSMGNQSYGMVNATGSPATPVQTSNDGFFELRLPKNRAASGMGKHRNNQPIGEPKPTNSQPVEAQDPTNNQASDMQSLMSSAVVEDSIDFDAEAYEEEQFPFGR